MSNICVPSLLLQATSRCLTGSLPAQKSWEVPRCQELSPNSKEWHSRPSTLITPTSPSPYSYHRHHPLHLLPFQTAHFSKPFHLWGMPINPWPQVAENLSLVSRPVLPTTLASSHKWPFSAWNQLVGMEMCCKLLNVLDLKDLVLKKKQHFNFLCWLVEMF